MNKIYLVFVGILICFTGFAQSGSRVVAFSGFQSDTTISPLDTGGYQYVSGGGGSMYYGFGEPCINCYYPIIASTANLDADYFTDHHGITQYDTAWRFFYTDTLKSVQIFNTGHITATYLQTLHSGTWNNSPTKLFAYGVNDKILQETDVTGLSDSSSQTNYTYDSSNRLILAVYKIWDSTYWKNNYEWQYTYDSSGNLVISEYKGWNASVNAWQIGDKRLYYYTSGVIDSFVHYSLTSSFDTSYYRKDIGIYLFSSAFDTVTLKYLYYPANTFFEVINTFDPNGNTTARMEVNLNPRIEPEQSMKWDYRYNSFNQLIAERAFSADTTGNWVFESMNRYYYEPYTPNSVATVAADRGKLLIYPLPAQNVVTVKLDWEQTSPFSIAIYDISGRQMVCWHEPAAKTCIKTLPIAGLPAGNYFIKAENGAQQMAKQLIVTH